MNKLRARHWKIVAGGAGVLLFAALIMVGRRTVSYGSPPARAFYYWKTEWTSSPSMLARLKSNKIQRLYMRFFDVEWDDRSATPYPVSPLRFESAIPVELDVVPVVYIVNSVFLKIPYADVEPLANHVWDKVSAIARTQGVGFHELQIDCDWTDSSRRNYFHFAELLQQKLASESKTMSATIRLHQVKYVERTGIPPAARGMLMFYNFGKIQAAGSRASIFNAEDAGHYASFISSYPMTLDIVLPMFSWSIHSRDGRVMALMEEVGSDDLDSFDGFRRLSANRYAASRSFFFRGHYFMEGDLVSVEETTPEMTSEAATLAKRGAGYAKRYETVALFDLDEKRLGDYTDSQIGAILDRF